MECDVFTLDERMVEVGDGHQLYCQLWGNPDAAQTIVFLHGGPGNGCHDSHKQRFDPERQQVIFFDQRGCGKSLPYGSIEANTTDKLVEDITVITRAHEIEKFMLTGGSWGSCLALVYAIRHPEKVLRLVIHGVFTGRQSEIDYLNRGGFQTYFPEVWERFVQTIPEKHRNDPAAYHIPRVLGNDQVEVQQSALALSGLQLSLIALDDRPKPIDPASFDPTPTIIEYHYHANHNFLNEGYIFENAGKLTMPIDIVQGRYDAVCPPVTAYELHQALPNSRLFWTVAGHSGRDRANADLVKALLSA